MNEPLDRIRKWGIAAVVLVLVGGSLGLWDWLGYPVPPVLDPPYDPFAFPSERTRFQDFIGRLRGAKSQREDWWAKRTSQYREEREMIRVFGDFQFAGNRLDFSYHPADESEGAHGQFFLSDTFEIRNLILDEGTRHPFSSGMKIRRTGKKSLVLETGTERKPWRVVGAREAWEMPLPLSSFPSNPSTVNLGPELKIVDEDGNLLVLAPFVAAERNGSEGDLPD